MFASKAEACPSEAPFRCSTLGFALALPANIRLGWKGLPRANTLAYCGNPYITAVKSFIVQAAGNCYIFFYSHNYFFELQ